MFRNTPVQRKNTPYIYFFGFCLLSIFLISTSVATAQHPPTGKDPHKSSFEAQLINIEQPENKPFRFSTTLYNGTSKTQIYDLDAKLPDGWHAVFKTHGSQVTSLKIDSGKKESISLELYAAHATKPTTYKVPIIAISEQDSLTLNLDAVVKGSYGIRVTTPTGRLSDEVTEGSQKEVQLVVKNTASLPLKNIELSAQTPTKWNVSFESSKIENLDPGATKTITATLKVPDKTIVGDYMTLFKVKNKNVHTKADFRITVVTSLLTGWVGILVILLAIALVYFLVRKYGRR